ncbi:helix-turn-helix transcriptional regulator [Microbacterium sp. LjRoot45]|uniref:helix-turn-helix domain-containing protein n=1 Tax=Microbacterium sp. LjRoot45 TaxID=3342329 RepID=UPI003ECC9747
MSDIAFLPRPNVERRQTIAKNVKAHLGHAGISGAEMGRRIGMTQSKMSRRTTAAEPFDIDELGAIADELDITVVDLITGKLPSNDL